ncbi:uncharacterized protein LOC117231644 [Bombus vosnesenskii]|uniref:Gustatory receptor n=1 Tax=Bombus vosnesenskii TaxID=207650 RepID=A0A6J3K0Z1_9HYME|nr:uncharacterized protein LOC117231644 [Bombus vosnesenskii]
MMLKIMGIIEELKKRRTWKLLRATDFESLMYPCFFIFWLLGYFPYKYEHQVYSLSKSRFAFSTSMMFIFVCSLMITIYEINIGMKINKSIPESIHVNMYLFLDGFVIVVMYLLTDARLLVIQNLSRTSCILSTKDFKDLSKVIHTKDVLCFLFLGIHIPNCFKHSIFLTLLNFMGMYIMMANLSIDMLYINCTCILKDCFKKMDESIRQLKKLRMNNDIWMQTFVHHRQLSPLLVVELKNLEEKHLEISDGLELLNNMFMIRVIIAAITTFSVVTFDIYFYIISLYSGFPANSKFWYKPYVTPAAFYFIKFWVMIWACETATNRARKMKTTLWDVFSATNDPFVKREVELFSLQIMHTTNIFTAKTFDMNSSFLAKIVGGIIMYILILFQFLLNYVVCTFHM